HYSRLTPREGVIKMSDSQSAIKIVSEPEVNRDSEAPSSRPPASTWIRRKNQKAVLPSGNESSLDRQRTSSLAKDSTAMRIVEALIERGVDTFFGIPGGPMCPIVEALRLCEGATLIEARHEANAGFAAAAYYRATGRPAGVVVTAGPGATNAITGITSAYLENIPVFVL